MSRSAGSAINVNIKIASDETKYFAMAYLSGVYDVRLAAWWQSAESFQRYFPLLGSNNE